MLTFRPPLDSRGAALFQEIAGDNPRRTRAQIAGKVGRAGRDDQRVAWLELARRLAIDFNPHVALEEVEEFLAGVGVLRRYPARREGSYGHRAMFAGGGKILLKEDLAGETGPGIGGAQAGCTGQGKHEDGQAEAGSFHWEVTESKTGWCFFKPAEGRGTDRASKFLADPGTGHIQALRTQVETSRINMTNLPPERIAIIGGGFSGVMTAVNLARLARQPLHLTIINQRRPVARGAAYGTRRMEHLLNVAARNMSAFPDMPDHLLQWLRTRPDFSQLLERDLREQFIPRMIYGDYLTGLVHQYLQAPTAAGPVQTVFLDAEAVDVEQRDGRAAVLLASGERVAARRVVLATGNEPPAALPGSDGLQSHRAWIGNPWQAWEDRLPPSGGTILLLGTGLTTVDAVMTLRTLGWQGEIHAVSRNGWLPHPHFRGIEYPHFPPPGTDLAGLGLEKLLPLIEKHCTRLRELGANPAIIVDKMRPHTQRIWQRFTPAERREFARHHAARWNVLRHRIAPEIHAQLATAQLTGQLQVHAASIEGVQAEGTRIRVRLNGGQSLLGDLVINATGPNSKFTATSSVLLQNLLRRGVVVPDELEMGVWADADHTVIDRDGQRSETLLALGPLLRGTLWETIAVPELRIQARRTAETILHQSAAQPTVESPVMMEYMI